MIQNNLVSQSKIINLKLNCYIDDGIKKLTIIRENKKRYNGKIVIIGAGLSGLCCAYELKKLGFDISIIEADKNHIGGRVRTIRFDSKNYGDVGAMRIPKKHKLTREYIKKFRIPTRKFIQNNPESLVFIRNKKYKSSEEKKVMNLFNLKENEKKGAYELWNKSINSIIDNLNANEKDELFKHKIINKKLISIDQKSLLNAMHDSGMSSEAIEFLSSFWGMSTSLNQALTEKLREEIDGIWSSDFDEIVGGTDLLASAFHDRLKQNFLRAKVIRIEQDSNTVNVYASDKNTTHCIKGDWVICTVPLGLVNQIDFLPALSNSKLNSIRRVNYDSATKILGQTSNRFWELKDSIYGGGSTWGESLGSTWYPSDNTSKNLEISNSKSVFLASYTWGQESQRIDSIPSKDLKKYLTTRLGNMHSSIINKPDTIKNILRWSWSSFPLSNGAYAHFNPSDHTMLHQELIKPEGHILFAGEHTSLNHGWMQGALESGIRVVLYICDELKRLKS